MSVPIPRTWRSCTSPGMDFRRATKVEFFCWKTSVRPMHRHHCMRPSTSNPYAAAPKLQFYFYDACRINPAATAGYDELKAGIYLDLPRGAPARASWVCFGARPRDYAYADPQRRVTLYSQ